MQQFKYRVFLSYSSHDQVMARWLHRRLESYRVPNLASVSPDSIPHKLSPVFRDREELSVSSDLSKAIQDALHSSENLVVLCSPAAARSRWVNQEIIEFKRSGREDRIFPLIIDGVPGASLSGDGKGEECFPPALLFQIKDNGDLTDKLGQEPLAADLRPEADGKSDGFLKLVAPLIGVRFDQLKRRDAANRRRRLQIWVASLLTVSCAMAALAGVAVYQGTAARSQRDRAEKALVTANAERRRAEAALRVADKERARAQQALNDANSERARAEEALRVATAQRDRARQALMGAHAAASGLTQELAVGTSNWPGVNKAYINRMLIRAQNVLLAALAAGKEDQEPIRRSLAIVYSAMASLQVDFDNLELAERVATSSLDMFQRVLATGYEADQISQDIVIVRRKLGDIALKQGDTAKALDHLEKAKSFAEQSFARTGGAQIWRLELAMTRTHLGTALAMVDSERAIEMLQKAEDDFAGLTDSFLTLRAEIYRAENQFHLGRLLCVTDQKDKGLETLQRAESLLNKIVSGLKEPNSYVDIAKLQVSTIRLLGLLFVERGSHEIAMEYFSRGILRAQDIIRSGERTPEWADLLASFYEGSGHAWLLEGNTEVAQAQYMKALEQREWIDGNSDREDLLLKTARLQLDLAGLSDDPTRHARRAADICRRFVDHSILGEEAREIMAKAETYLTQT